MMGRDSNSRRFPGFDVVKQSDHWDARTRDVVLQRFRLKPGRSFFSVDEEAVCRALLAALLAIGPNDSEIRVFEMVDGRLAAGVTDGWRYEDMPPDTEAWRLSLAELGSTTFLGLGLDGRLQVLEAIRTSDRFAGMPAKRLWDLWMRYACTAYYSHPAAWNEIGFGGPAYPRGYKNMGLDRREPWEVEEVNARDPIPWAARLEAARGDDAKRQRVI